MIFGSLPFFAINAFNGEFAPQISSTRTLVYFLLLCTTNGAFVFGLHFYVLSKLRAEEMVERDYMQTIFSIFLRAYS